MPIEEIFTFKGQMYYLWCQHCSQDIEVNSHQFAEILRCIGCDREAVKVLPKKEGE